MRTVTRIAVVAVAMALAFGAAAFARPEARQSWRVVWIQAEVAGGGPGEDAAGPLAAWEHAPGNERAILRVALPACGRLRVSGEAWLSGLAGSPHVTLDAGGPQASVYPQVVGSWTRFAVEAPAGGAEAVVAIGSAKEAGGWIQVRRLVVEVSE